MAITIIPQPISLKPGPVKTGIIGKLQNHPQVFQQTCKHVHQMIMITGKWMQEILFHSIYKHGSLKTGTTGNSAAM